MRIVRTSTASTRVAIVTADGAFAASARETFAASGAIDLTVASGTLAEHCETLELEGALFPTEIRLRANGICNTIGRAATVVSPFVVGFLMVHYKLPGVLWLMIALLVVQIVVVFAWGVEPRNRALEDVAAQPA
jgi:MFS family permease